jgi:hypothetical protein
MASLVRSLETEIGCLAFPAGIQPNKIHLRCSEPPGDLYDGYVLDSLELYKAQLLEKTWIEHLVLDFWEPAAAISLGLLPRLKSLVIANAYEPGGKREMKSVQKVLGAVKTLKEFRADGGNEKGRAFWNKAWKMRGGK